MITLSGGSLNGRKIEAVPGSSTRPTLSRVRESLFTILRPSIDGLSVLDTFAGTGCLGIEAISQGAGSCLFTDNNHLAVKTVKLNVKKLGIENSAEVRKLDAFSFLKNCNRKFDLIFVDPPRFNGLTVETLRLISSRPEILSESAKVITITSPKEFEKLDLQNLKLTDTRKYGSTLLGFYSNLINH